MSQKIALISAFLYAKLEIILGSAAGLSVIALNIEELLIKGAFALVFGGLGAIGAHLTKKYIIKEK
ncbi:MAG TPA: hypothetical protein VD927_06335 [Chryseosolibacter sp.]|nr:hypothetical protein [Chryseosolibacter sp.]